MFKGSIVFEESYVADSLSSLIISCFSSLKVRLLEFSKNWSLFFSLIRHINFSTSSSVIGVHPRFPFNLR
jgi:hypothetical protein